MFADFFFFQLVFCAAIVSILLQAVPISMSNKNIYLGLYFQGSTGVALNRLASVGFTGLYVCFEC